jgi:hypothetical protein
MSCRFLEIENNTDYCSLKEEYGDELTIKDLHLVWFSKALRNFKCVIVDLLPNSRYYECTYNGDKDELYVDVYVKEHNRLIKGEDLSDKVREAKDNA